MKNLQKGFLIPVVAIVVAVIAVGAGVEYFKNKNENVALSENTAIQRIETETEWKKYENSYFPSFSYPKEFKLNISGGSDVYPLVIKLYPQSQPKIEFGPFISFSVYDRKNVNFLDDVKKEYGTNFISSESVEINGRNWIRAVIRDDYFETLEYEYYFTSYKNNKYLAVIHSKNHPFLSEFKQIISSIGNLD